MNPKQQVKVSKLLSLVLRHEPEAIGLKLDQNGWASVKELLPRLKENGHPISLPDLQVVVSENPKKRFSFSDDGLRIRANQGHSLKIDLALQESEPPSVLYHGTTERNLHSIFTTGLEKKNRHHVHLSVEKTTALEVGKRYGKPALLQVDAEAMALKGFRFFVSDNGVWLTDSVPMEYLKLIDA